MREFIVTKPNDCSLSFSCALLLPLRELGRAVRSSGPHSASELSSSGLGIVIRAGVRVSGC
jgi:hypothetical protein